MRSVFRRWVRGAAWKVPGLRRVLEERDEARDLLQSVALEIGNALLEADVRRLRGEEETPPGRARGARGPRVTHVSRTDQKGGAAKIASLLHRRSDVDSWMLVDEKTGEDRRTEAITPEWAALDRLLRDHAHTLSLPGLIGLPTRRIDEHPRVRDSDVVHLHNPHPHYFDLFVLPRLSRRARIVWTLHDEFAVTGHCAFTMDCEGWRTGCDPCPHLSRYVHTGRDRSAEAFRLKAEIYEASDLTLVCPSEWLARRVPHSILAGQDVRVIPNGVDVRRFRPGNQRAAREALGLPTDGIVCLYAADGGASNPFKGGELLQPIIKACEATSDLSFAEVGGNATGVSGSVHQLGYMATEADMATCYQAADMFLYPTRADSFGLVVAEAMACGIPVIASDVGAIPELVVNGETGLLAPVGDITAFTTAIREIVSDDARRKSLGEIARVRVLKHFSEDEMVHGYGVLYNELVDMSARA